jgi:hypothetical protein
VAAGLSCATTSRTVLGAPRGCQGGLDEPTSFLDVTRLVEEFGLPLGTPVEILA